MTTPCIGIYLKSLIRKDKSQSAAVLPVDIIREKIQEIKSRFGNNLKSFLNDPDYRDAVKMNLFQIGELVNTISDDCKEQIKDIPWHELYGMRNIIGHGYIKVNDEIIWQTAAYDIPELKIKIDKAISMVF